MKDGPGVPTRTVHTRGPARVSAGQSFSRLPAQPRLAGAALGQVPAQWPYVQGTRRSAAPLGAQCMKTRDRVGNKTPTPLRAWRPGGPNIANAWPFLKPQRARTLP